jgi:hypothetical protein
MTTQNGNVKIAVTRVHRITQVKAVFASLALQVWGFKQWQPWFLIVETIHVVK